MYVNESNEKIFSEINVEDDELASNFTIEMSENLIIDDENFDLRTKMSFETQNIYCLFMNEVQSVIAVYQRRNCRASIEYVRRKIYKFRRNARE